jgi:DNA-binding LacI/PurR family transcriptional regulator
VTAPITQKDIARKLGVSVTLVSRVLSGKAHEIGAATATVESIRQTAAALGYVPNATARILRGAPTRTLGVVVYDFEDPFLGAIIGALQRLAHQHDRTLVLVGFEHRRVDAHALRPLAKHGIDGLIVVGSGADDDWLGAFRARRLPVARIGTGSSANQTAVAVDSAAGIDALLGHLARRGFKRAGFVGDQHPAHCERLACFAARAAAFGIETRPEWQVTRPESAAAAGHEGARAILQLAAGDRLRALLAASDAIAIGALRALQEARIAVPATMAVTGFDDIPLADLIVPALTTIRQPVAAMAQTAFVWVTGQAPATDSRVLLPGELVVRESA